MTICETVKRAATNTDLLDVAKGHLAAGGVFHAGCGGRIIYSLYMERFQCTGCMSHWAMKMVKTSTQKPFDSNFWVPPMEFEDGNGNV